MVEDMIEEQLLEEPKPTFGERSYSFWMEGKKYDPEVADRMTSFPAVVGGIGFLFGLMFLLSWFMG